MLIVSGGFPPKPITDNSGTLSAVGIRDGDVLNVKLLDTPIQQEQARPPTPPPVTTQINNASDGAVETPFGLLVVRV